jgi:hypothetical protein
MSILRNHLRVANLAESDSLPGSGTAAGWAGKVVRPSGSCLQADRPRQWATTGSRKEGWVGPLSGFD